MATIIQEMLHDIYDRVYFATGEPPKCVRGSRFLGQHLIAELMEQGVPLFYVNEPWVKPQDGCFTYMGMTVRCDLPTDVPTVVARLDRIK